MDRPQELNLYTIKGVTLPTYLGSWACFDINKRKLKKAGVSINEVLDDIHAAAEKLGATYISSGCEPMFFKYRVYWAVT